MKNIFLYLLYTILTIIALTFLITILEYTNILNGKVLIISKIIVPIISIFIFSFILGKKSKNKGYQKGLIFGLIFGSFNIILSYLILRNAFQYKDLIYFLITITTSTLGSMIGITKRIET